MLKYPLRTEIEAFGLLPAIHWWCWWWYNLLRGSRAAPINNEITFAFVSRLLSAGNLQYDTVYW